MQKLILKIQVYPLLPSLRERGCCKGGTSEYKGQVERSSKKCYKTSDLILNWSNNLSASSYFNCINTSPSFCWLPRSVQNGVSFCKIAGYQAILKQAFTLCSQQVKCLHGFEMVPVTRDGYSCTFPLPDLELICCCIFQYIRLFTVPGVCGCLSTAWKRISFSSEQGNMSLSPLRRHWILSMGNGISGESTQLKLEVFPMFL